jgi:hypothetical protein
MMPMNELVELKKQIVELQAKGFPQLIPVESPCSVHGEERRNPTDVCGLPLFERGHH